MVQGDRLVSNQKRTLAGMGQPAEKPSLSRPAAAAAAAAAADSLPLLLLRFAVAPSFKYDSGHCMQA